MALCIHFPALACKGALSYSREIHIGDIVHAAVQELKILIPRGGDEDQSKEFKGNK